MLHSKIRVQASEAAQAVGDIGIKGIRYGRSWSFVFRWMKWILICGTILVALLYEMRTSALQSRILSHYASKLSYKMGPGPSNSIMFPRGGPFDVLAGYAQMPDFLSRLEAAGFKVTAQARFSPDLERVASWGILPPFRAPVATQLTIRGMDDKPLFAAPIASHVFNSFEEIPPQVIKALLLIENRELEQPPDYRTNPVVDWDRLAKAALLYAGHKLGLPVQVEGGSTLATQIEKYRHSDRGRTDSVFAKLRQMTGASLLVYSNGPDTREKRRQIIVDYLNTVPLAAAPRYGELHGVGNALYAWFGLDTPELQAAFSLPDDHPEKLSAFKRVLALLCAVRAPSYYLVQNRTALEARANFYVRLMATTQVITQDIADRLAATPLVISPRPPVYYTQPFVRRKAVNEIRTKLLTTLNEPSLYDLDRLHLDVNSTIDVDLQRQAEDLLASMADPAFVDSAGLRDKRTLATGDPAKVIYGLMLYEKTPEGNALRVTTDTLDGPFDINSQMKMQLGSTAKLRTLSNYLFVVAALYKQFSSLGPDELREQAKTARDPITVWAAQTLSQNSDLDMDGMLQAALDRKYSASPYESFFTGGGIHVFNNFDREDNGRILTIRAATERSVNLVFIRLMRDLVRYYETHLPYDAEAVISDTNNPVRKRMLREIADGESRLVLYRAYKRFKGHKPGEIVPLLLGKNAHSDRHLSILFYAWHHGGDDEALGKWLQAYLGPVTPEQVQRMSKAYSSPRLNLSDYGYLLGLHPLDVWCAGEMSKDSARPWASLWDQSSEAHRIASAWLFKTRNRQAQDLRLRIRFEEDAFARMTPFWQRLGFPFEKLIPSLATAIGSSGDRPAALAYLMGILVNDGVAKPNLKITQLRFASGTPYETVLQSASPEERQVLPSAAARAMISVLSGVVKQGTAVRLANTFKLDAKPIDVGGKTGSGDNRFDAIGRWGNIITSRAVDRTAVFVFHIGERYYGVVTAYVPGKDAEKYVFTSALPVSVLKLLAPAIEAAWTRSERPKETPKNDTRLAAAPVLQTAKADAIVAPALTKPAN